MAAFLFYVPEPHGTTVNAIPFFHCLRLETNLFNCFALFCGNRIGWKHIDKRSISLDEFERKKQRSTPASSIILSRQHREVLLVEWGATFNEIIEAIRSNVKAKHQRRRTINNIGTYDRWEEVMESARSRIKRTLLLKPHHKDPWQLSSHVPPRPPPPTHNLDADYSISSVGSAPQTVTIRKVMDDAPPKPLARRTSLGDAVLGSDDECDVAPPHPLDDSSSNNNNNNTKDAPPRRPANSRGGPTDESSVASFSSWHTDAISETTMESDPVIIDEVPNMSLSRHHHGGDGEESEGNSFASYLNAEFQCGTEESKEKSASSIRHEEKTLSQMEIVVDLTNAQTPAICDETLGTGATDSPTSHVSYCVRYNDNGASVRSHLSNLTSLGGSSSADGNFESLTRDCSFWDIQPGTHDSPRIRRKVTPVVINEDFEDLVFQDGSLVGMYPKYPTEETSNEQQLIYFYPLQIAEQGPQVHQNMRPNQTGFVSATAYNVVDGNYSHQVDNNGSFNQGLAGWDGFGMAPPPNSTVLISKWE